MTRRAFSLLEIMVVLAIVAIVSSLTFGVYKNISDGNKRTTCSSNLGQIYSAARQYSRDYDGNFPYFDPASLSPSPPASNPKGIGLWALYTYGNDLSTLIGLGPNKPAATYLRNPNLLHCPSDKYNRTNGESVGGVSTSEFSIAGSINAEYLSYQIKDDGLTTPANENWTYSSFRLDGASRQLVYFTGSTTPTRRSPDNTVLAWCRFHRKLESNGTSLVPASGNDNILFLDGSVQNIAVQQFVNSTPCESWKRVPRNQEATGTCP